MRSIKFLHLYTGKAENTKVDKVTYFAIVLVLLRIHFLYLYTGEAKNTKVDKVTYFAKADSMNT